MYNSVCITKKYQEKAASPYGLDSFAAAALGVICLATLKEVNILEIAQKISRNAHLDQERKNGSAYITHVEHVVKQLGEDNEAKIVGWLHDVIEDSDYTSKILIKEGISQELVKEVELLTKKREHTYAQYINVIKTSKLAMKVKKADLIANLSDNPSNKQIIKLSKALIQLCSE